MIQRKPTRKVFVGKIPIGGDAPISVQSMTTTDTRDVDATSSQIAELEEAGCQIVRMAVVDQEAAQAIREIRKRVSIPLVADIHFDYRLALECIRNGADKIRINPGNIGGKDRVQCVVKAAKERGIPIRIGINMGSLEKDLLQRYGASCGEAMVESAGRHIRLLQDENFEDIVVSLKASDVLTTIEAYTLLSQTYAYPLHLGVTEAGTLYTGTIKSSIGIGALLSAGIGDTIRVSLTSEPVREVAAGRKILSALGLLQDVDLISCPTCGRCRVNVIEIASALEEKLAGIHMPLKVAVMGCAVNGPGEAREADIGIAGGDQEFLLFQKGKIIGKVPAEKAVERLMEEIQKIKQDIHT